MWGKGEHRHWFCRFEGTEDDNGIIRWRLNPLSGVAREGRKRRKEGENDGRNCAKGK